MNSLKEILSTTWTYLKKLEEVWIKTVKDLLLYFPRTYESHNQWAFFSDLRSDQMNNFKATICNKSSMPTKTWRKLYKCTISDSEGSLAECIWFAKPFFWEMLLEWKNFYFIWKAKINFRKTQISSPKVEFKQNTIHSWEIVPVYPQIWEKLTSQWFREKIHSVLFEAKKFEENLPETVLKKEKLIWRSEAIKNLHFPKNQKYLEKAKERMAFEELFFLQKKALISKEEIKNLSEIKNVSIKMNTDLIKDFFESLPFIPTNAQKIAIFQCLKDMEREYPMNRLLEWDVWSWKTLVAIALALTVLLDWKQVALMSPTEVLTRQHFYSMTKMIKVFEEKFPKYENKFKIWLLLWALTPKKKQEVLLKLHTWEVNFLIWTHALISDNVSFENLWIAMIDEQHRFWVAQREKLTSHWPVHILNITATPIPRTLALVAYWDQDISVLNEMPAWRKIIKTSVVNSFWQRKQVHRFMEIEIEKWRQIYVVCPLIEESEKLELKSVKEEYANLIKIFPKASIWLMYWKLKSKEKDEVMNDFKEKKYDILVSTSVIEVWVDVPNATIMIIEWAERFWLSQLHQFRGRVWRSEFQSYCFLFTTDDKKETARLTAMETYSDWFSLAEIDMKLRWPWEVYWVRQSWIPDLKMASMSDHKMVLRARSAAEEYLEL